MSLSRSGWSSWTLDEITSKIDYGHTASATQEPIGPRFLRITDIQNGAVDWGRVPYCECSDRDARESELAPGDIVFARTGATTGKSFLIKNLPETTIFASYLIRLRLKPGYEPRLLSYFFQSDSYWAQIKQHSQGATLPGVNASKLRSLKVALPDDTQEQQRIADILDEANALRLKRTEAIRLLEYLMSSLFYEMFGNDLSDPKKQVPLDELAEIGSGVMKGRKFNGEATVDLPYLRVANVQAGFLDLSEMKTIPVPVSEAAKYRLQHHDIVLTEGGDYDKLGRGAIWESQVDNCVHQNHIFRVRCNQDHLLPLYFVSYLQSRSAVDYFLRCAKKTTNLATINMTQLRQLPVCVPSPAKQKEFVERLVDLRLLIAAADESRTELDKLFHALQERAFRGEL